MHWTHDRLDFFVSESDSKGGPNSQECQDFWKNFNYKINFKPDESLDPFSEEYVMQQVCLYEEISGHKYDIQRDENSLFEMARHVEASNPYNELNPSTVAIHIQRLLAAIRHADPQPGSTLLDLGCGWGLSSEVFEYLGFNVIASDINTSFVQLVNNRAQKRGTKNIKAIVSTFEDFSHGDLAQIAFFYECLHHAIRPWKVLSSIKDSLDKSGSVVLAGEPINEIWWKNWGIRLDPISIYCIRKFGWFESGWSLDFIKGAMIYAGFIPKFYQAADPEVGISLVGTKYRNLLITGEQCMGIYRCTDCIADSGYAIFNNEGSIELIFPQYATQAVIRFTSFRQLPLRLKIVVEAECVFDDEILTGDFSFTIKKTKSLLPIGIYSETWTPSLEGINNDGRKLGVHLASISFD